jgi:hypothetical protein
VQCPMFVQAVASSAFSISKFRLTLQATSLPYNMRRVTHQGKRSCGEENYKQILCSRMKQRFECLSEYMTLNPIFSTRRAHGMQKPCTNVSKCTHHIYQDLVHRTVLTSSYSIFIHILVHWNPLENRNKIHKKIANLIPNG